MRVHYYESLYVTQTFNKQALWWSIHKYELFMSRTFLTRRLTVVGFISRPGTSMPKSCLLCLRFGGNFYNWCHSWSLIISTHWLLTFQEKIITNSILNCLSSLTSAPPVTFLLRWSDQTDTHAAPLCVFLDRGIGVFCMHEKTCWLTFESAILEFWTIIQKLRGSLGIVQSLSIGHSRPKLSDWPFWAQASRSTRPDYCTSNQ